jgi:aspartyl-tRNA(Asn)/glutamyl-tRNA(Gln) amidotransferase subunit A
MTSRRIFLGSCLSAPGLLAATRLRAQPADLTELTLVEASTLIRQRQLSPVELTQAYLDRIRRLQPVVNAYITVTDELALQQAAALEAELAAGQWRGPLHGIPIALKDNIDTAGILTTGASAVTQDRKPQQDAPVWVRLREAGAILLGKLNMHEFAWGGTSAITHFGPVHNPWNLAHIPGGSSGGSAAAVAARLCCAALGTDTLASIRLPAAYCGVVGFKATHGLTSIRNIIPVAESLDHAGPLTRSIADAALLLQAMAGFDALDPVSIHAPYQSYAAALSAPVAGLRIGMPDSVYFDTLDADIEGVTSAAINELKRLTASAVEVTLPAVPDFGLLLAESVAWHQDYLGAAASRARYDPATLARLDAAAQVSAADYIRARHDLVRVRHAIAAVFDNIDVLVTPTAPNLPETISGAINPAEASGAEPSVRNTAAFNLYGIPTVSIPIGFSTAGLPIGLQLSGATLREDQLFALASAWQQTSTWHLQSPAL